MLGEDLKRGDLLYAIDKENCFTVLEIDKIDESIYKYPALTISVIDRLNSINSSIILFVSTTLNTITPLTGKYHYISCSEQLIINKLKELCSK